jgi:speckle-type POZ protein
MEEAFNWFRPGFELVKVNFQWNVQVPPFLQTTINPFEETSSFFSSSEIPERQWRLQLFVESTQILIIAYHYNSAGQIARANIRDPVLLKISIVNKRGQKVHQRVLQSKPGLPFMHFKFYRADIEASDCRQSDGSLTFYCKILCHVMKELDSPVNPPVLDIDCWQQLANEFENLFDEMPFSDVTINVHGREFPAHKIILVTRSQVFAAMFNHPTKEKLTNQIVIEDVEPDVFHQLLRFMYTGRLTSVTMEAMAAALYIAADKYLLDRLKLECENYLLCQMSSVSCLELLLHAHLLNPAKELKKKTIQFFRQHPGDVMATDKWKKAKQENPAALCDIHQMVMCNEIS